MPELSTFMQVQGNTQILPYNGKIINAKLGFCKSRLSKVTIEPSEPDLEENFSVLDKSLLQGAGG